MSQQPGKWIYQAVQDYAGARCLLLQGLPSGFVLAQQTIEKLLKARHICMHGASPRLKAADRHNLPVLAELIDRDFPSLRLCQVHGALLMELYRCFENKYPDGRLPESSTTTAWLGEIDELAVTLMVEMPMGSDQWRTGIYWAAWPLVLVGQPDPPWLVWFRERNSAFERHLSAVADVVRKGHDGAYGSAP